MDNYKPKYAVGTAYRKLADQRETANSCGDWDPEKFTTEDSAFGFVVMENGATVFLETSWALNIGLTREMFGTTLCGTEAGADMIDKLRINGVKYGKQYVVTPDFAAGGVAFYDGVEMTPAYREQRQWYDGLLYGTDITVKPEQAYIVSLILEAIYESNRTGEPVYFNP